MTSNELNEIGHEIWGYGWQTRLADLLGYSARHIQKLATGKYPISRRTGAFIRLKIAELQGKPV